MESTIASLRCISLLNKVDFPTFGLPTIAIILLITMVDKCNTKLAVKKRAVLIPPFFKIKWLNSIYSIEVEISGLNSSVSTIFCINYYKIS